MLHVFTNPCDELESIADPDAFIKKLAAVGGPSFIGQGGTYGCGSDRYGYYITAKKELPNKKTIWGYTSAKTHTTDEFGHEVCDGPESWQPEHWIIARGKTPSGMPKWWECDANGIRYMPSRKCRISWTGATQYFDPSF